MNYASRLDKIAEQIVPEDKRQLPEYISCAKSVVLYFFEMCDIGKKYEGEQLSFLDKWQNQK